MEIARIRSFLGDAPYLNKLFGEYHDFNHMGTVLLSLMRPDTAGVHRRARVMVIDELSPTAGVTVTERGGVRNGATAGMGGMSAAHAASTTVTVWSVPRASVTWCVTAAGVPAGGRRGTSGAGRQARGGRGVRFPPSPPPPPPPTAMGGGPTEAMQANPTRKNSFGISRVLVP